MPKISDLPAGTAPTGAEKFPAVQGVVTARFTLSQVYAATKTLTNTTFDTAGSGNSLSINGVAATANTGTGSVVRATSPTLVTPALGTPSSGILTNATGLPIATGVANLGTNVATFLTTPSSANLIAALTDETGTGSAVFATSPTLVTPALGTPSAAVLTNATGLPISTGVSGLASNVATFLATPSSANLRSALSDETGTGLAVFATAPTITTPNIVGVSDGSGAAAGSVSESFQQDLLVGSAATMSNGVITNVTSKSVSAGRWIIWGNIIFSAQGTTAYSEVHGSTSLTSQVTEALNSHALHVTFITGQTAIIPTPIRFLNISSPTTVYLTAACTVTAGSAMLVYGSLFGIRLP